MKDIHSVSCEYKKPRLKDFARAAGLLLRGRTVEARAAVSRDTRLVAKDASGNLVMAISGGDNMTVFVNNKKNEPAAEPAPPPPPETPKISNDDLVLQQPVAVRTNPLSFRKPD